MSQTAHNPRYVPESAFSANPNREHDDDAGDAPGPIALAQDIDVDTTAAPTTGIRKSPASSTSTTEQQDTDSDSTSPTSSSSPAEHMHHDPRRGISAFTTPSNLPAWAVAALQETLDQPWKAHFDGDAAERDMSLRDDPDFARGRDEVPFYDGRLKVCYGEGSISA